MNYRNLIPLIFFLLVFTLLVSAEVFERGPAGPLLPPIAREDARAEQVNITPIVMVILGFLSYYFFKNKKAVIGLFLIGLMALLLVYPALIIIQQQRDPVTDWQRILKEETDRSVLLKGLTIETRVYDYSDSLIQNITRDILSTARNQREAIQMAITYTYENVRYEVRPNNECFMATSSSVLKDGYGDCDMQSVANIGLLRAMGIPAKPAAGCIWSNTWCNFQFAIMSSTGLPVRAPKFQELNISELEKYRVDGEYQIPRGGDIDEEYVAPRGGGLHAWVSAWIPDEEWVHLESTAGSFIYQSCFTYDIELYPTTIFDTCVSTDYDYAYWCSQQ